MSYDPRLHPQIVQVFEAMKAAGVQRVESLTPEMARHQHRRMARARVEPEIELGLIETFAIDAPGRRIPVRMYHPPGFEDAGPLPVLFYFHGGGHVIGDLDTHDRAVRALAKKANCLAISVDYRKGPENRFPGAVEDCFFATKYFVDRAERYGIDADRVAVGGDSAGGNLATVVALMARDQGGPKIIFQLLVYPVVDYRGGYPSYKEYGKGFGILEEETVDYFRRGYLADMAQLEDWRVSPILASSFEGLPPAIIQLAELDVLHDEGVLYAEKLREAGVPVEVKEYKGQIHAFYTFTHMVDDAHRAQDDSAEALRKAFGTA
ncbi:alpha/beta hydrolase [Hwanghaeella grinnelliae]|uniref:Alpha/beta hydrolase n=1 Tax=Hwanghaeella grinnelliae TaxID=2500179 RepID=A0A3S2W7T6_9PROT|nr:alpha/beta hydrolase [Hwanghaeella grinnelliae]RVU34889.1 alpha/beta hydrolase [Hwanghaeella grinnelliae]